MKCDFRLSRHNLLPGFDIVEYPFIINCDKYGYHLISLKTGNKDILIKGTAHNANAQLHFFFTEFKSKRFNIDFCTVTRNGDNLFEHNWNRMVFNDDFVKTLHHNGRLPIDSLEKQQKLLKKLKLKDQKIEELKQS